jgi:hypothetical protein
LHVFWWHDTFGENMLYVHPPPPPSSEAMLSSSLKMFLSRLSTKTRFCRLYSEPLKRVNIIFEEGVGRVSTKILKLKVIPLKEKLSHLVDRSIKLPLKIKQK